MLAYYAKRSSGEEFQRINAPLKESGVWVSGVNMSDAEIDGLIERYGLDTNVVYDVRDRGELPRVEYSDKAAYVFTRSAWLSKAGKIQTLPLLCVLTNGSFLTMSIGESIEPESVALSTLPITTDHTQTLLLGVTAAVVASFEDIISHTARSITDTATV